ncbi:MAG: transposase [Bacillota bacterium]|nr:transposase [Bacillota bacterium]
MPKEERRKIWASRVAEYRSSGQSVSQWCQKHGVKEQQMWYWLKKEREAATPTKWVPVELGAEIGSVTLRVAHVSIEVCRGFDQELLLSVIRALSALC